MRCANCGMSPRNTVHHVRDQYGFHPYVEPQQKIDTTDEIDIALVYRRNHLHNIERESEVLKNVVRDICTTLSIQARDLGHAALAVKYIVLRDELEAIFPKER